MRALLSCVWLLVACGDDGASSVDASAGVDARGDAGAPSDAPRDAGAGELVANAGESAYALVGEEVVLDGSASTGAATYQWSFGDGRDSGPAISDPIARVIYDAPGRYSVVLTVFDAAGRRRSDSVVVTVTRAAVHAPRESSTVAVLPGRSMVAAVATDADEIAVWSWDETGAFTLVERVSVADEPRTVAVWGEWLAVSCQSAGAVELVRIDDLATKVRVDLPYASRPFGVTGAEDALYVSLQGTGELARIVSSGSSFALDARMAAIEDARGVAVLPDGRVAVTRWRSPDERAEIAVVDPSDGTREVWTLAYDPQPGSDTESGGVPSYLEQLLVDPTGTIALVPSLQAAIGEGLYRSPRSLSHQTTVRAVVSFLDPATGTEDFDRRKQFDDRGLAAAGTFTSRGDFAFLAMRGARAVERIDVLTQAHSGSIIDVGFAPDGLALSEDDRFLFVNATLSRELVVYDVRDLSAPPAPIERLATVASEPLDPVILRGKQLFNDSFDTRLALDSYIACAHCHLEGQSDRRTWDFTDRGEGLRNTIDLLGRAGAAHGPIHWSGNFDEVHDFEHDIRGPFGGTGLMTDEAFSTCNETLGNPKAGLSEDLDALAAYVTSLDTYLPSPHRNPDGTLTAAAARGKTLFESAALSCTTCHAGAALTDSRFDPPGSPVLHDVGTLGPGSGGRLGATLAGIDTPTLHGLFHTPPYLHDGSAPTLRDVLTTKNPTDQHGTTSSLTPTDLDDLIAYLSSLDGRP